MISEVKSKAASVSDSDDVKIQVVIGEGQAGGWAVQLGTRVFKGVDAVARRIGSGAEVRAARVVQVSTVVVDVRPETDRLSAIVTLSGGSSPPAIIEHAREGARGDVAQFTSLFVVA